MRSSLRHFVHFALPLALIACAPPMTDGDTDATDAPVEACSATRVREVRGRVVDELDMPIADARVQLCARIEPDGNLVCLLPPRTAPDGTFLIEVDATVSCMSAATMRVFVPGGGFATTYCAVDLSVTREGVLTTASPIEVFRVPAATVPPRGDATLARDVDLGAVILNVAPGALPNEEDYASLGARFIDPATSCLPAIHAMNGLVLFTPEAELRAPASITLRIPEARPGARYEVHILGGIGTLLEDGTSVEEGHLARVGVGTVDADGLLRVDARIRYLSQLAVSLQR